MRTPLRRNIVTPICLVFTVLLTGIATAAEEAANGRDRNDRRAEMRQKILEEFDADGDGEMSQDERATAREEMRKRRGGQAKGGGAKGDRAKGLKAKRGGAKGNRGAAQGGRPGGPPDPGKLFDKFDANGDGQLSRAEFMKLTKEVRANRPQRGRANSDQGRRDSARRGRPARPDGPPEEARRRFATERSLQNPGDRPGPPPRPEGRRRLNDRQAKGAEGPRGRDRGDRGPRGPGAEGRRPPNPEAVFERFDENGDDQLSRDEFMKLADRMREMHERMGHGGEHGDMRDGRSPRPGSRRGGPGEDGPSRRPRRPRPESDAGPELRATDDNSV